MRSLILEACVNSESQVIIDYAHFFFFNTQVFQDIVLPMNQLEDQIDKSEELFDLYPVLVYPCRIYDHGPHR